MFKVEAGTDDEEEEAMLEMDDFQRRTTVYKGIRPRLLDMTYPINFIVLKNQYKHGYYNTILL